MYENQIGSQRTRLREKKAGHWMSVGRFQLHSEGTHSLILFKIYVDLLISFYFTSIKLFSTFLELIYILFWFKVETGLA